MSSWPGAEFTGLDPFWSVVGLVFGLGFVQSFGYWTTNFVEVQRAMASSSLSAGRRSPIIGAYPKMLVPFIVVVPGIIAAVLVPELAAFKAGDTANAGGVDFNDTMPLLIGQLMPNGMLGVALAGLLAAFMAGMAANISAFNTVFSYDIWQTYVVKDKPDHYYLEVGRVVTVIATVIAIGTAFIASNYTNLMDYLQTLFSFFNAPLFGVFIVGLFWKTAEPDRGLGGAGARYRCRRRAVRHERDRGLHPARAGCCVRAGGGRVRRRVAVRGADHLLHRVPGRGGAGGPGLVGDRDKARRRAGHTVVAVRGQARQRCHDPDHHPQPHLPLRSSS